MVFFSPFTTVYAFSYVDYEQQSISVEEDFHQNQHLVHSSGRFFYIYLDKSANNIVVVCWSSEGSLLTEFTTSTVYGTTYQDNEVSVKILEINSTYVLIVWTECYADEGMIFRTMRLNINTWVALYDYLSFGGTTYTGFGVTGIDYVFYQDDIYLFVATDKKINVPDARRLTVFKYIIDTYQVTQYDYEVLITGGTGDINPMEGYLNANQNPNALAQVLLCFQVSKQDEYRPWFWLYNLGTLEFEEQSVFPMPARFPANDKFFWLGSGYRYTGDYIYAYFTWLGTKLSEGQNTPTIYVIQHRLVYNVTIEASELKQVNTRTHIYYPQVLESALDEYWVLGYIEDDNASIINYYNQIQTSGLNIELWETQVIIPDWFNYDTQTIATIYQRPSDELIFALSSGIGLNNQVYDTLWKDFSSSYQTVEKYPAGSGTDDYRMYYDLTIMTAVYDMSFTIIPDETPKIVNKSYKMTMTSLANNVGFKSNTILYFDGSQVSSKVTDSAGVRVITFLFGTEGIHTITVKIYQLGTSSLLHTDSYSDIWSLTGSETDDPDEAVLIPLTVAGISIFMPIFFIVLVPMFALGEMAGKIGIMAGLIIGVTIGAMSGLLPMYTVFLMILVVVMAFVFLIRGGRF